MLLLLSAALAAEPLPVGHHVVVQKGAVLRYPGGEVVPGVPAIGFTATVVADDGDTLRVAPSVGSCAPSLKLARELELQFSVAEADLLPLVAAEASGANAQGQPWKVAVGTPLRVLDTEVELLLLSGLGVRLPRAGVTMASSVAGRGDVGRTWGEELYAKDGVYGRFGGQELRGAMGSLNVERAGGDVVWRDGCVSVQFTPATEPKAIGGIGGLIGGMAAGTARYPTGTAVTWADGSVAGRLRVDVPTSRFAEVDGARACSAWKLDAGTSFTTPQVRLCVEASTQVGASSPPPRGGGLGSGGSLGGISAGDSATLTFGDVQVEGSVDAAAVAQALTEQRPVLRYCYQRALVKNPKLEGSVLLRFAVDTAGVASGVSATGSMSDATVRDCVQGRVQRIKFPTGGAGIVHTRLDFAPKG